MGQAGNKLCKLRNVEKPRRPVSKPWFLHPLGVYEMCKHVPKTDE